MNDCLPQVHVAAIHAQAGYHGDTPGLGIICRNDNLLVGAGFYRNSIARHSNYGIVGYQPFTVASVRLGVFAGVVNGYVHKNGNYFLAGGVIGSVPLPFGELHVVAAPKTSLSPAVAEFSFSIKF